MEFLKKYWGLTEVQKAYIAAFLDGEGAISITKGVEKCKRNPKVMQGRRNDLDLYDINAIKYHYHLVIVLCNNHKPVMEWLANMLDVKMLTQQRKYKSNHNINYRITLRGQVAQEFLEDIIPYLIIKKERAYIALQFPVDGKPNIEFREKLYQEMKKLNVRGISLAETERRDLGNPEKALRCDSPAC